MSSNFVYRSVWPTDLFAARALITKVFLRKEPLTSHVRLTEGGFHSIYDQLLGSLDYKTSIVALPKQATPVNSIDHDILACLVTAPLDAPIDESKIDRTAIPLLGLVNDLDVWFKENVLQPRSIPESRVLHVAMGATRDDYHGKGLLGELMSQWLKEANDGRWDMAVAECTSPISRHLLKNRLGWTEGKVLKFDTFEVNGERPFKGLEGEAALVYKELPG
ncbi:hypothetical protein CVT24_003871 [Panaeolus cyanescens]|uniref:N-acetyltransferase domain-containing protein n=1 Tax=Panaeolus cyanescens TaxID=181874 RepID=A0A409VV22_9AGAR|nr:hypothetical protein CVT24_003871 [Panaeolus cyanescens]